MSWRKNAFLALRGTSAGTDCIPLGLIHADVMQITAKFQAAPNSARLFSHYLILLLREKLLLAPFRLTQGFSD